MQDRWRTRLRLALDATPWGGRNDQARRARRARARRGPGGPFYIDLPDLTGRALRPVYLERNSRYATVTSVKLLDRETLVCASFLERTLYLVRFDAVRRTHRILDAIPTTWRGTPVETDLADADPTGTDIVLSNFHHGSFTHYRREGDRLRLASELDTGVGAKVHGVRFLDRRVFVGTLGSAPTGVCFFDLERGVPTLRLDLPLKAQDAAFLPGSFPSSSAPSAREMLVLAVHGAPRRQRQAPYASSIFRVRFDLAAGKTEVRESRRWEDTHFDACVTHANRLYLTDQRNDCVRVLDPSTLAEVDHIDGYDFPHGLDIGFGLLAVSNYGSNALDLRPLDSEAQSEPSRVGSSGVEPPRT
ncbi:MAG: hypothetical protein R3F35_07060 [Myxococcota bacterium]